MTDRISPLTDRALSTEEAAALCACSRRHFEQHIAPALPFVDLKAPNCRKAMPRYLLSDVTAWLMRQRKQPVAA